MSASAAVRAARATGTQRHGPADEILVVTDAEVGEYRGANVTRLVDEIGGATHAEPQRPPHVVHTDHELVDVGEQGELQLVLFAERAMARRGLWTHAGDVESRLLDLDGQVADRAGLARAPGSEVRRIEIQDQRTLAQQRAERHSLLVLVRQRELRRSPAHSQHACSPVREPLRPRRLMIAAWRNAMLESRALRGAVAQLGERRVRNAKVEGSIPFRSISPPSMAVHESARPRRARQGHTASPEV